MKVQLLTLPGSWKLKALSFIQWEWEQQPAHLFQFLMTRVAEPITKKIGVGNW